MELRRVVRAATWLTLVCLVMSSEAAAQSDVSPALRETERQILQMEETLRTAIASRDVSAVAELYWPDLVDIHGSGWIYTKDESMEVLANRLKGPGRKVIQSSHLEWRVVAYGADTGIATGIDETYYEVPNPQTLAREAGLLTRSPQARTGTVESTAAPGDGASAPNPYRIRTIRLWVRRGGQWKIAAAQSTRVGERVQPGR